MVDRLEVGPDLAWYPGQVCRPGTILGAIGIDQEARTAMTDSRRAFERAMRLAVVSGLRSTLGVALMEAAYDRPNRKAWALAALGEMVVDKVPGVPSRASLPVMLPRAVAGGYVAKQVMEREGVEDPWAVPMGAAVASGVAALAPRIRGILSTVLGVPSPLLGLVEDYIALKVGGEALGMSMDDVKKIGEESVEEIKGYLTSVVSPTDSMDPSGSPQSVGAGSM
jgi:hypothetical protein